MPLNFQKLEKLNFNLFFNYHSDAILYQEFSEASVELENVLSSIEIPIEEIVRGGGGEAQITQRLRRNLYTSGWEKQNFIIEKHVNHSVTQSQTHEIDHVKKFDNGTIALEIEWNNKDPFFDRDLENFNRLHSDGAISIGIIITRGRSFQDETLTLISNWAQQNNIKSFQELERFDIDPTRRQKKAIEAAANRENSTFPQAWAKHFISDKFGQATTHWVKLEARLSRGVGSPCPIIGIGIPITTVKS
jgi:hypothetical protein